MKLKLLFAATVAFAAFPAQAQDGDASGNFTGPRIEARASWDRAGINIRDTRNFGGRGDFGLSDQDNEIAPGFEGGFDVELGSFVVGGYVGIDFSDAEERFDSGRILLSAERNLYAGGRIGIVAARNVMVYGKGGFSRARLEPTITGTPTFAYPTDEDEFDGYHFGGGVELAVAGMFYLRADYTHTQYETLSLGPASPTSGADRELRFNRNQITGGIGIRF